MLRIKNSLLFVFTVFIAASAFSAAPPYFDPSLRSRNGNISVIVTGPTSKDAAAAVKAASGSVVDDLRIIDAVSATIAADRLPQLVADARVVSIIENKKLRAADMPGYVSDKRIVRGTSTLNNNMPSPGLVLPDGGFAIVANDGTLLIGNDDGGERIRVTLPGGNYGQTPIMTSDGNLLVTGGSASAAVSLVRPDGSAVWQTTSFSSAAVKGNSVVGTNGLIYVIDNNRQVTALGLADGKIRFQTTFGTSAAGNVVTTPAIGADNSLYIPTSAGQVWKLDANAAPLWSIAIGSYSLTAPPQLSVDGGVYVICPGKPTLWVLDSATGKYRFTFTAPSNLSTNPLLTSAGSYIGAKGGVYALTLDGRTRWGATALTLSGGTTGTAYDTTPAISADGSTLYFASTGSSLHLLAESSSTGAALWRQWIGTKDLTLPTVDPEGGITVGDASGGIQRYSPSGTLVNAFRFKSMAINHLSQASPTGSIVIAMGSNSLYQVAFFGRIQDQWNGRKDVIAQTAKLTYRILNPVSIDVGADVLHSKLMTGSANTYIQGNDVVVAVVDSGVYWDPSTKFDLGPQLQLQFIGQADFIDTKCLVNADGTLGGVQYSDYCFADYNHSLDAYGHGTHVAGTISNQLKEEATGVFLGIAPQARLLSARVLDANGNGTYDMVVKGIQWIIDNKSKYNVRVLNLSLSAYATVPYFVDPLDRAVEKAWQAGIVVVAAAGNTGPFASTITVPGNDPYVITAGAVNSGRTPAYWRDDIKPSWSATGPTFDGFAKPEIVAPGSQIVSYMYNGGLTDPNTPTLARLHPDYSATTQLFRMNGTSMATGVTSGVVALMLQVNPFLTPNQVKYRLMSASRWSNDKQNTPVYNTLQQGLGRLWAPDAVLAAVDPNGQSNLGMDINQDLAHGYATLSDLNFHYQGPVKKMISDSGTAYLYYATDSGGTNYALGVTDLGGNWLPVSSVTQLTWAGTQLTWAGGLTFGGDAKTFTSTQLTWAGTQLTWAGTRLTWAGTHLTWAGTQLTWAGGLSWAGGPAWSSTQLTWAGSSSAYSSTQLTWAGSISGKTASSSSFQWIEDNWIAPAANSAPPPAGAQ